MKAKDFGKYIKELRKNKGMTIRQLELYSGVSNSYLSQLENGKRNIPSSTVLKKLSSGLDADYTELMVKAGHMEEPKQSTGRVLRDEEVKRVEIIDKIASEFSDADLMFGDLANMSAEQLEDVYEFIKFKRRRGED